MGEPLVILVDAAGLAAGLLEPVEEPGGRVDLVAGIILNRLLERSAAALVGALI